MNHRQCNTLSQAAGCVAYQLTLLAIFGLLNGCRLPKRDALVSTPPHSRDAETIVHPTQSPALRGVDALSSTAGFRSDGSDGSDGSVPLSPDSDGQTQLQPQAGLTGELPSEESGDFPRNGMEFGSSDFGHTALGNGAQPLPGNAKLPERPPLVPHPKPAASNALKLKISGVDPRGGPVRVAVFSAADQFPNYESASVKAVLPSALEILECEINYIPVGPIAIAVYQDVDGDGQLNRSSFGVPIEPYGFSNNARGRLGPPTFKQAMLEIGSNPHVVPILLTKLKL